MGWYSILPSHLTVYETWIIRAFLILAVINISPWIIAILYDLFLYIARRIWHEIPYYGGRARGETRPRATSLRERVRRMSLAEMIGSGSPTQRSEKTRAELRKRQKEHHRAMSNESTIEEDDE